MPAPEDSILKTTKTALGLTEDYTPYDAELTIHINSVLANLNQLGIGPIGGMSISGYDATWDDFLVRANELVADPRLNHVKSYTYLKVKMLFDPPNLGYVIAAYEKMIAEAEWRIMVANDDVVHPRLPAPVIEPEDPFYDPLVISGGAP